MADKTDSKSSHNKHNTETNRRIVPIVPVIPRKFERNLKPKNEIVTDGSPPADDTVKFAKSESFFQDSSVEHHHAARDGQRESSEEDQLVDGERKLGNPDDLNEKAGIQIEFKENGGSQIFETRWDSKNGADEENIPASGIERGYIWRSPHTVEAEEKSLGRPSSPELINEVYPSTEHPSSYIATTPPADEITSRTQTDYRGYGHIPHPRLQPEHTPPTDPTPSPKGDSYEKNSSENLGHVQESSPAAKGPHTPGSLYHGYTYGNVGPKRQSLSLTPPSIHDVPKGQQSPPHHYENMLPLSSNGRSDGRFSADSSNNSSKSHKDDTGMSANTLRRPVTKVDDSVSESRPSWAHAVSPTSSLGSFHQPYQTLGAEIYAGASFVMKRESWRSTTLHSLNQPVLEEFLSQIPLNAYLLGQFDEEKYADIRLEVIHERDGLVMAEFKLHSLIMARNKTWQDLMNASTSEREGLKLLQLRTNDQFITSQAIQGALRVLYGEPSHLFIGSCLQIDLSKQTADTSLAWMDNALSFAASGLLLGLEEVIVRGLHIASSILCWDNLEKALSFALHGGLDSALDPDHALRVDSLISLAKTSTDSIPSPVRGASGSLRKRAKSGIGSHNPHSKAVRSGRSSLLPRCLDFIALEFPMSWDLETSACPLADIDRLPLTAKDHSPSRKARLVSIRFGDCPPEILSNARHRDSVLSSILLSLPFGPLKYILDQLPQSTRSRIIRPIVDERERRRTQVLKDGEIDWSRRIVDADNLAYLGWKEYVVTKQDSCLALERRWTNFDEPHDT